MKTFDQMILEIRTTLSTSAQVNWGTLKQAIAAHPDREFLQSYLKNKGKNPDLEGGDRRVLRLGEADFAMRWIPSGTFSYEYEMSDGNERPQHAVTLTRGFWMMETPVTQGQYLAVMGEKPSHFKKAGSDAPVEQVDWYKAATFANKLSVLEGANESFVGSGEEMDGVGNKGSDYVGCKGWRLPTEAEWEYACRAGATTPRYGELDEIAWYKKNSGSTTHAVGQKQANAWGLHDTLGNVWEWCYDWYGDYPTQAATDPTGEGTNTYRVLRGGGWYDSANYIRAARRFGYSPTHRYYSIGFRLVRSAT